MGSVSLTERRDREVRAGCSGSLGLSCWQAAALGWNALVNEKSLWLKKRKETSYSGRDRADDCAYNSDLLTVGTRAHRAEVVLHDPHPRIVQVGKLRLVHTSLESHSKLGAESIDVVGFNPLREVLMMHSFGKHEGIAQHGAAEHGVWDSAGPVASPAWHTTVGGASPVVCPPGG